MPRTSRSTVVFTVDGTTYEANFKHEHTHDAEGLSDPDPSRKLDAEGYKSRVKHITICLLKEVNSPLSVRGVSKCSMGDGYQWRLGIKQSFMRALGKANLTPTSAAPEVQAKYGKMMKAFFEEMRVKDYNPALSAHPTAASRNPESDYVSKVPVHNQHGLGHAGMD